MEAHKFGNVMKDEPDNRIKIIDNKFGEQILEQLKIFHRIEQQIVDQLENNRKELRKRIVKNINDVKDMLTKESYTIVLNDTLQKTFEEPINCENCEIALVEFKSPALLNINNNNNSFEYSDNNLGWKSQRIPKGCYSIVSLQKYLHSNFPKLRIELNGTRNPDRIFEVVITMRLKNYFNIKFPKNSIVADVFGFETDTTYDSNDLEVIYNSELNPKIPPLNPHIHFNNPINIHLNCIKNNYFNTESSPIVYSFFNSAPEEVHSTKQYLYSNCTVNEKPPVLIYHPIREKFKNFKVEIKDQDGKNIELEKCYLKFHIRN